MGGGYDLTKATQMAQGAGVGAAMLRGARQAPVTSNDHPLAGHSPPKARYSPKGKAKGARMMHDDEDMPKMARAMKKKRG